MTANIESHIMRRYGKIYKNVLTATNKRSLDDGQDGNVLPYNQPSTTINVVHHELLHVFVLHTSMAFFTNETLIYVASQGRIRFVPTR